MKVYELLDSPDKWTKYMAARDTEDMEVEPEDKSAVKWCLAGAIRKLYLENIYMVYERITNSANIPWLYIPRWNDIHSYEEVIALCKELDI